MSGVACQFSTQVTYGDAQKVHGVLILGAAPDLVNKLVVRPDPAGMMNQNVQKMILGRRQSDLVVSDKHLPPVEIHSEIAGREGFALRSAEGPP